MLNDVSEREGRIAGGGHNGGKNEGRLSDGPPLSMDFERERKDRVISQD
jgi:hypothetical protein